MSTEDVSGLFSTSTATQISNASPLVLTSESHDISSTNDVSVKQKASPLIQIVDESDSNDWPLDVKGFDAPMNQLCSDNLLSKDASVPSCLTHPVSDESRAEKWAKPSNKKHSAIEQCGDAKSLKVTDLLPGTDDDESISVASNAMEAYKKKPESELTREDMVWALAEKAGSTMAEDRVELDASSKERLQQRVAKMQKEDKVSLSF